MDVNTVHALVEDCIPSVVEWRRAIHANPELSGEEKETSAYVQEVLTTLGIPFQNNISGYAVIGRIDGKHPGKTIALRADMDALPIKEENDVPFASTNEGVMHACGHDSHVAMLLGAAAILSKLTDYLHGSVVLVFQPAEEKSPIGGAQPIMDTGVLDAIDEIYGLHVWPDLPVGQVGLKAGALMAASDHFYVTIRGQATHAAEPQHGNDALVAAANWIMAVQTIVSRQIDPLDKAVVTIGTMEGGVRYNVVAEEVRMEGTCRTFDPLVRDYIEKQLAKCLHGLDTMFGTTSTLVYKRGYHPTVNYSESIAFMTDVARKYVGEESISKPEYPSMCAEDFSAYLTKHKGAFIWIGTGYEGNQPLHNATFNIDESILSVGVTILVGSILERLKSSE